jgi:hypothetical protein
MKNPQKGSFTIEAIVIMSTVMLSVIAVIYIIILFYQITYLQSAAYKGAVLGATMINAGGEDVYTGKVTMDNMHSRGLYRRLYDTTLNEKTTIINNHMKTQLNPYNAIKGQLPDINIEKKNYIIYSTLNVSAKKSFSIPGNGLLSKYGLSDIFPITTTIETTINDPAEFIRNTDFIADTVVEVDDKTGGKLQAAFGKIKSMYQKISDVFP